MSYEWWRINNLLNWIGIIGIEKSPWPPGRMKLFRFQKMRSQSVITWLEYSKNEPDVLQHRILENYAVLHLGNYAVLLSFDTQTIHVFCIVVFKIATIENWFPFCPSWINSVVKRFFGNVWKSENLSHGVTFLSNLACRQPRTAMWTDPSVLSFS